MKAAFIYDKTPSSLVDSCFGSIPTHVFQLPSSNEKHLPYYQHLMVIEKQNNRVCVFHRTMAQKFQTTISILLMQHGYIFDSSTISQICFMQFIEGFICVS